MNSFQHSEELLNTSNVKSELVLRVPKRIWDINLFMPGVDNNLSCDEVEKKGKNSNISVLNSDTSLVEGLSLLYNIQSNRPDSRIILNLTQCMLRYLSIISNGIPQNIQSTNAIVALLEESLSAITSLDYENLYRHLRSLHIEKFQLRVLRPMLSRLMLHTKNGGIFNTAVDVVGLGLTDYHDIIEQPIDFSIIKNKLLSGVYENISSFKEDVYLVFKNALIYNAPGHIVFNKAKMLLEEARVEIESAINKQRKEDERRSSHTCEMCCGNACALCGEKCLKLESPVLVCYGTCCQRIKKNGIYYVSSDGMYMWCQKCYTSLPTVVVDACSNGASFEEGESQAPIYKCDLLKRKLEDELYEPWVQCGTCSVWVHQVCALFNDRMHAALISPSRALYDDVFAVGENDSHFDDSEGVEPDALEHRTKTVKRHHSDASVTTVGLMPHSISGSSLSIASVGECDVENALNVSNISELTVNSKGMKRKIENCDTASNVSSIGTKNLHSGYGSSRVESVGSRGVRKTAGTETTTFFECMLCKLEKRTCVDIDDLVDTMKKTAISPIETAEFSEELKKLRERKAKELSEGDTSGTPRVRKARVHGGLSPTKDVIVGEKRRSVSRKLEELLEAKELHASIGLKTRSPKNAHADKPALSVNVTPPKRGRPRLNPLVNPASTPKQAKQEIETRRRRGKGKKSLLLGEVDDMLLKKEPKGKLGRTPKVKVKEPVAEVSYSKVYFKNSRNNRQNKLEIMNETNGCDDAYTVSVEPKVEKVVKGKTRGRKPKNYPLVKATSSIENDVDSALVPRMETVDGTDGPSCAVQDEKEVVVLPNDVILSGSFTPTTIDSPTTTASPGCVSPAANGSPERKDSCGDSKSDEFSDKSIDLPSDEEVNEGSDVQRSHILSEYDKDVKLDSDAGCSKSILLSDETVQCDLSVGNDIVCGSDCPIRAHCEAVAPNDHIEPVADRDTTLNYEACSETDAKMMHCASQQPHQASCPRVASNTANLDDAQFAHLNPMQSQWKASSLPPSQLSNFIEVIVKTRLKRCNFSDECCNSITIRMVSNSDQQIEIPSALVENLATADGNRLSTCLPYRQKCILLFQEIDGVDICLFCLYVQEFDSNCPPPNTSRVYIAYLDSVEYFRPMEARTIVYHEIMVAYLQWAQARRFKHANIWSCPPQRGDNFIFWCHPHHQRTPSRDRLNAWYKAILTRCMELGIVCDVSNLYTRHFQQYDKKLQSSGTPTPRKSMEKVDTVGSCGDVEGSSMKSATFTDEKKRVPVCPAVFEGDFWVTEFIRLHRLLCNKKKSTSALGEDSPLLSGPDSPRGKTCSVLPIHQAEMQDGRSHNNRHNSYPVVNDKHSNKRKCREILKHMMSKKIALPFNAPVDTVKLKLDDYYTIIKEPMDLATVRDKLRGGLYPTVSEFVLDVRLVFYNALLYNAPHNYVHQCARTLLLEFECNHLYPFVRDNLPRLHPPVAITDMELEGKLSQQLKAYKEELVKAGSMTRGAVMTLSRDSSMNREWAICYDEVVKVPKEYLEVLPLGHVHVTLLDDSTCAPTLMSNESISNEVLVTLADCDDSCKPVSNVSATSLLSLQLHHTSIKEHCVEVNTNIEETVEKEVEGTDAEDDKFDIGLKKIPSGDSMVDDELDTGDAASVSNSMSTAGGVNYSDHSVNDSTCSNSNTNRSALPSEGGNQDGYSSQQRMLPFGLMSFSRSAINNRKLRNTPPVKFDTEPELSMSGLHDLMSDLARNVDRLKDDFFVFDFASGEKALTPEEFLDQQRICAEQEKEAKARAEAEREVDADAESCAEEAESERIFEPSEQDDISVGQSMNCTDPVHEADISNEMLAKAEAAPELNESEDNQSEEKTKESLFEHADSDIDIERVEEKTIEKVEGNGLTINAEFDACTATPIRRRRGRGRHRSTPPKPLKKRKPRIKKKPVYSGLMYHDLPEDAYRILYNSVICGECTMTVPPNLSTSSNQSTEDSSMSATQAEAKTCVDGVVVDPDMLLSSPFVDARHTFLEMCQYRHYQFDTLRHAKHSSLLLLYHLHHPFAQHLRPSCHNCHKIIRDVRWHCDYCSTYMNYSNNHTCVTSGGMDHDICNDCYNNHTHYYKHPHVLTPYRVTFL